MSLNFIKSLVYIVVVFLLISSCKPKEVESKKKTVIITNTQKDAIRSFLKKTSNDHNITGLTYSIQNDVKTFDFNLGEANIVSKNKIDKNTVFSGLEFSELFVATAILKLKEKGKLKLTDPVVKHLPYFKLRDSIKSREITIHHLLTHTSGLPTVSINLTINPEQENPNISQLEVTTRGIAGLLKEFDAGKKYKKTYLNYDILADLISKISGISFEDFMKIEIFKPLEMTSTTYHLKNIDSLKLVTPYQIENIENDKVSKLYYYPFNRENAGSNGLHTTPNNILNWTNMLLNNGVFYDEIFLKKENVAYLLNPFHVINPNQYIGYSWELEGEKDNYVFYKSFSNHGLSGSLLMYPSYNLSMVLQSNFQTGFNINLITKNITDFLISGAEEIQSIKVPVYKKLIQTYNSKGLKSSLNVYKTLKENKTSLYNYSFDEMIKFINYILTTVKTNKDFELKKEEVFKVLEFCNNEFPNSARVALTYADTYLIFKDTVLVNSYIDKAKILSKNAKEVVDYGKDLQIRMRKKEQVVNFEN